MARFKMNVDRTIYITGRGEVLIGKVVEGQVRVGQWVRLYDKDMEFTPAQVCGIERFVRLLQRPLRDGEDIGLLVRADREAIKNTVSVKR